MVSVSDKAVRISHTVIFALVTLASIVALAISASLVSHYNSEGYPPVHTGAYRDRIRILLVASVWSTAFALILVVGFQLLGTHRAFGTLAHLVTIAIGFILFIIGSASLTALTDKTNCSKASDAFDRCKIVKGLVIISWIDTIFLFVALVFVLVMGFIAHRSVGLRNSTLYAD